MAALLSRRSIPAFHSLHCRALSTLPTNPHIYHFPDSANTATHLLTLLPTDPPTPSLALGTTTRIPPTPSTFIENPLFLQILNGVLAQEAPHDPSVIAQAAAFASPGGSFLGSGMLFPQQRQQAQRAAAASNRALKKSPSSCTSGPTLESGSSAGAGSSQGGISGVRRGGWIHVSDTRNPPDYGRIAWPEDIFGSLEVDGEGKFVDGKGNWQASGTYRVITNEGILGLPQYLHERLVERLMQLEDVEKSKS